MHDVAFEFACAVTVSANVLNILKIELNCFDEHFMYMYYENYSKHFALIVSVIYRYFRDLFGMNPAEFMVREN